MNNNNVALLENNAVIDRVFEHIDNGTTDLGTAQWREVMAVHEPFPAPNTDGRAISTDP